uniref:Uncharacterized protein n=1 Tax=Aegilops tauschii subsp. strangulata TaxID=200361 RepID=A0A453JIX8_AEGTS
MQGNSLLLYSQASESATFRRCSSTPSRRRPRAWWSSDPRDSSSARSCSPKPNPSIRRSPPYRNKSFGVPASVGLTSSPVKL